MNDDCGCGVKFGWPLRWFRTPQFIFHLNCCFHDRLYRIGGDAYDKKNADEIFYQDMRRMVDDLTYDRETKVHYHLRRAWYSVVAFIYYMAVRNSRTARTRFNWHTTPPPPPAPRVEVAFELRRTPPTDMLPVRKDPSQETTVILANPDKKREP